jgi:hypothetical protein
MFIRIINIKLGNSAGGCEQDKLKYSNENRKCCVLSQKNMIEKIVENLRYDDRFFNLYRDGDLKCYPVPKRNDVIKFVLRLEQNC